VTEDVTVVFHEAGHILGSASVEMRVREGGKEKVVVFSGDIGPRGVPLMNDPEPPRPEGGADVVILESTYGDRDHRPLDATEEELREIMKEAVWSKEKVLVPAFAVGRAQLALYYLGRLMDGGRVPKFPVYLDSPMAIEALGLYERYARELDETMRRRGGGGSALDFSSLRMSATAEESRRINEMSGPLVVIAGSGMCTGGRIVHHLRHNLWKKDVRVLIVGYQAERSLGRQLVRGAEKVRIFGDEVPVRAKVSTVGGLSAHAGQTELAEWGEAVCGGGKKPMLVLTHGEDPQRRALAGVMKARTGLEARLPRYGEEVEV
jgi:metallo-beta-lactamase family protein